MKLREATQECLESKELVPHALHFIKFIPANNDLHPQIALLEQLHPFGHLWVFPLNIQAAHVDTHREYGNVNKLALSCRDSLWHSLKAENTAHCLAEMTSKVGGLEADEICSQQAVQAMRSVS